MTAIAFADRARRQRGQGCVLMSVVTALPGAGAAAMLAF
jgi:hypothetical protein